MHINQFYQWKYKDVKKSDYLEFRSYVSNSVLVQSASTKYQIANISLNPDLACIFCWLSAQHWAKSHKWYYEISCFYHRADNKSH